MPYNDEQVSIVQKLESNDGVVVQGPPGIGKTHTIANVICHYLAQGKRVLVTAKGESALAVLQEKLPERIRALSVALLSDERNGIKQFEHSVQTIASSVAAMNPTRAATEIVAAEEKLNQLHSMIATIDRSVAAFATKHMSNYKFQGRDVSPETMAKSVLEQYDEHRWFDDEPSPTKDGAITFDSADVDALRRARLTVGKELTYLGLTLPVPDELPAWPDLASLHRDLLKAQAVAANVAAGRIIGLADSRLETFEQAKQLAIFLDDRLKLKAKLAGANQAWLETFVRRLAATPNEDRWLQAFLQLCSDVRSVETARCELRASAIRVPAGVELDNTFSEAIARLESGRSAFALPFGNADVRKVIASVTVLGVAPANAHDWLLVQQMLAWRISARKVVARWNSMAEEFALESTSGTLLDVAFKKIFELQSFVDEARKLVFDFDAKLHDKIVRVFGKQVADGARTDQESLLVTISASLQAQVDKGRLANAIKRVQELLHKLDGHSGEITDQIADFLTHVLGSNSTDEANLQTTWRSLQVKLNRLTSLRPSLDEINRITAAINTSGAIKWAARLRLHPAAPDHDPHTPTKWLEAWNWRQAVMFLDRIDGHRRMRELFEERKTLAAALSRTYQDLVAEKTWLGVFNNSPDRVRQALQAYLNAVQAMGAGTGVRAIRHRKTARDAMQRAYQAVPCWVLPQWRVSETLPAEIGLFDLVIIDEASQSDIWALPALLRGKKLLVVGDHKQVSPLAVGTANETINQLVSRFLNDQPHGTEMTPDKSIYDLARVVFAGNSVMLKEHFRCVPAIIEFSNREFYEGDIKPLRLPKTDERIDPPLVDIYVKGGVRNGDVNEAEAKAIVDEIEAILIDDRLAGRTIGVVTLLGTAQAAHIQRLVSTRISPFDLLTRKIAVGPPPVFQGRERDIMLVSMVLAPGDPAAQNRADMNQRFNVALSRARDRIYLFRSVTESTFKEDTLNARLMRHFRQPFRHETGAVAALREKCESGFEREMFDELIKQGYRVQPQVPCGGYRIDFVVEGAEGRRLAIECDGDRFHGPGQWTDDMKRQRVLERAGWTFWRCFASSFVRRRAEVVQDLMDTLRRGGIEPLGAELIDNSVWVRSREVDPFGVESSSGQLVGAD